MPKKTIKLNEGGFRTLLENTIRRLLEEEEKLVWTNMPDWFNKEVRKSKEHIANAERLKGVETVEHPDVIPGEENFMGVEGAKKYDGEDGDIIVTIPKENVESVYNFIEPEMNKMQYGIYGYDDDIDKMVFIFKRKEPIEGGEPEHEKYVRRNGDMSFLDNIIAESIKKVLKK